MTVFIIVGMPASGKNTARIYAESRGLPYFASGDLVRAEVAKRSLDPNPRNMSAVSTEMRGDDGLGVTRHVLETALSSGSSVVFMEGMRSWQEIEFAREQVPCVVVAFVAPRQVRLQRIIERGRSDDSPLGFKDRDMREISYGAAVPLALADEYILNTGTLDQALTGLHAIVSRYTGPIPRVKGSTGRGE